MAASTQLGRWSCASGLVGPPLRHLAVSLDDNRDLRPFIIPERLWISHYHNHRAVAVARDLRRPAEVQRPIRIARWRRRACPDATRRPNSRCAYNLYGRAWRPTIGDGLVRDAGVAPGRSRKRNGQLSGLTLDRLELAAGAAVRRTRRDAIAPLPRAARGAVELLAET